MNKYSNKIDVSALIQAQLSVYQQIIQRMSGNSTQCKTYCVTVVSAILVIIANKTEANLVWISILPLLSFLVLDAYYLSLERGFRESYGQFIGRIGLEDFSITEALKIQPHANGKRYFIESIFSISVLPFYLGIMSFIFLAKIIIFSDSS